MTLAGLMPKSPAGFVRVGAGCQGQSSSRRKKASVWHEVRGTDHARLPERRMESQVERRHSHEEGR